MLSRFLMAIILAGFAAPAFAAEEPTIGDLRCEYWHQPLNVDVAYPRLSWVFRSDHRGEAQHAYQVLVASTVSSLAQDRGDLWDSGKISSDQSIQIPYAGVPLKSGLQCFWKVRVWDKSDQPSLWSRPGFWSMGL